VSFVESSIFFFAIDLKLEKLAVKKIYQVLSYKQKATKNYSKKYVISILKSIKIIFSQDK
jgi:hypothetical protein